MQPVSWFEHASQSNYNLAAGGCATQGRQGELIATDMTESSRGGWCGVLQNIRPITERVSIATKRGCTRQEPDTLESATRKVRWTNLAILVCPVSSLGFSLPSLKYRALVHTEYISAFLPKTIKSGSSSEYGVGALINNVLGRLSLVLYLFPLISA